MQGQPNWKQFKQRSRLLLAIAVFVAIANILATPLFAQTSPASPAPPSLTHLSPPRSHPLPPTLAMRRDPTGDYFNQVQPVIVGALVWSSFPVTVYIEPTTSADAASPFLRQRSQTWIKAVQAAVQEWHPYLPLKQIGQVEAADIRIWRSTPPLKLEKPTGDRPLLTPRARSAETRFEVYAKPTATGRSLLAHRMTIYIRPDQATDYLQAAARHELGHALGIWGHSPNQADALYFSQVRNPAKISTRDINTLKRVYEQPTRLGWEISDR